MAAARCRRKHRQGGFTLVELLTVVVIIGVLVALLMPAILAARNAAKRAQCLNNHHEISTAIAQYDAQKGYLPGALNSFSGSGTISWAIAIFPYLGRDDLWEQYRSGGAGSAQVVKQYVCPLDNTASGSAPLSYVVNSALFLNRAVTGAKPRVSLSDVKSQSRTPLLADRISTGTTGRQWNSTNISELTFTWPTSGTLKSVVPSSHQGTVIITFCDGSTETLDEEAQANLYLRGP